MLPPTMYQRLHAPNDRNGNPRRCFVIYNADGTTASVIDEGYAGRPKECDGLIELPEVYVAASEYKRFLKKNKK